MDDDTPQLARDLRVLVDPGAQDAPRKLDVVTAAKVRTARSMIKDFFTAHADVSAVTVFVGSTRVGVVTRESLAGTARMAGPQSEPVQVGVGDRIQLPGASTRFRLLTLRCVPCGLVAHRVFYEPRDLPSCPHGLELLP